MKRICLSVAVLLIMVCPVLAAFDVGIPETFDKNLDGWKTSGNVYWSNYANGTNGYAGFGDILKNQDNILVTCFTSPCTGKYDLSFDYRFRGVDLNSCKDDCVNVDILLMDKPKYDVFSTTSSVGLTGGLLNPGQWQTITTPQCLEFEKDKKYWLCFELKSAKSVLVPLTFLDIDNILLTRAQEVKCIPAPGAIVLCSIGSAFIALLKRRRFS
jgi:hypothetical protein